MVSGSILSIDIQKKSHAAIIVSEKNRALVAVYREINLRKDLLVSLARIRVSSLVDSTKRSR